jgi:hypothetical protein
LRANSKLKRYQPKQNRQRHRKLLAVLLSTLLSPKFADLDTEQDYPPRKEGYSILEVITRTSNTYTNSNLSNLTCNQPLSKKQRWTATRTLGPTHQSFYQPNIFGTELAPLPTEVVVLIKPCSYREGRFSIVLQHSSKHWVLSPSLKRPEVAAVLAELNDLQIDLSLNDKGVPAQIHRVQTVIELVINGGEL